MGGAVGTVAGFAGRFGSGLLYDDSRMLIRAMGEQDGRLGHRQILECA